jgi:polysaccharide biosynthesis transport protein
VPTVPVLPRTKTNTVLAGVVGAMLAVGVAFLVEYLDDTIKTPDDVDRATGLPTFAAVARYQQPEAQRPLMAREEQSSIAEGYRLLRTNLEFSTIGLGHSAVVILVTSAEPQEGKTTTLANLGISLAQAGKRVILVDADLRRPGLHKQFGRANKAGLSSLILGAVLDLDSVLQETCVKGLRILPSGHSPANPAEVLGFPETEKVLQCLRPLADYILVDSPPLLSVTDAAILAQKVDGVLLVAEMGRVRTDVFAHAVGSLQRVKAHILGVVINKLALRRSSYYYGYDRYQYPNEGEKAERRRRSSKLGLSLHRLFGHGSSHHRARTVRGRGNDRHDAETR